MAECLNKTTLGQNAEQQAFLFLESKGLRLITRNFRCLVGEIDLIMYDGDVVVFVEVRKRSRNDFGDAIDSVNFSKQRKILKTATYYLQKRNWFDKVDCRFDVIGITQGRCEWIKNAFSLESFT